MTERDGSLRVAEVWRYPVKSLGGEQITGEVDLTLMGIEGDRSFGVVDLEKGRMCSLKTPSYRPLAAVRASLQENGDVLRLAYAGEELDVTTRRGGTGTTAFTIFDEQLFGLDQGDEPAKFFSDILKRKSRLVGLATDHDRQADPAYIEGRHQTSFTDGYPLTFHSQQSIEAVRRAVIDDSYLPGSEQIRSNLVLEGLNEFEEALLRHLLFESGAVAAVMKASSRCVMTETYVEADGSVVHKEGTLQALRYLGQFGLNGTTKRPKPLLAQNALVTRPGVISSGMRVDAPDKSSQPNWSQPGKID